MKTAMMTKACMALVAAALCLSANPAGAGEDEPAEAQQELLPMEHGPLRLSAIVDTGLRFLAGLVDTETGQAYLVPEGSKVLNWRVKIIDEVEMSALLEDADGDQMLLVLTGDEDLAADPEDSEAAPRAKTLAEFLAEYPELAAAAAAQEEPNLAVPTNGVVTFDDFLAAHPEMAGVSNYVAPELRGSTTGAPPTLTEADVNAAPITREEGLRRMAESVGMPVPEGKETTYEDFLKQNAPAPVPAR